MSRGTHSSLVSMSVMLDALESKILAGIVIEDVMHIDKHFFELIS